MNLASHPFVNRRPKRRIMGLLWTLAGIALLWNLWLFAQFWLGSSNGRDELRVIREKTDRQVSELRELQTELTGADLKAQNEQVRFLNRKIAERTFPWSRLFDDLADVLPRNVRLSVLSPSIPEDKARRGEARVETISWIDLNVRGTGKTSDDLFDLVDALFEHEFFAGPVLREEADTAEGVNFDLTVRYRVAAPEPPLLERSDSVVPTSQAVGGDDATPGELLSKNGERSSAAAPSSSSGAGVSELRAATSRDPGAGRNVDDAGTLRPANPASSASSIRPIAERGSSDPRRGASENADENAARNAGSAGTTASAVGTNASSFRPGARPSTATTGSPASRSTGRDAPTARPVSSGGSSANPTTEEIADDRFGTGDPAAPRLPNASGGRGER